MLELASFWLTLLGFGATLAGLAFTYRQARDAATAAEEATGAVEQFKLRSKRQEASRDIASVVNGMEETARHLEVDAWRNAIASYDVVRRYLIRLQVNDIIGDERKKPLHDLSTHIVAFCEAVELSETGDAPLPDKTQVGRFIRECYVDLAKIDAELSRDL